MREDKKARDIVCEERSSNAERADWNSTDVRTPARTADFPEANPRKERFRSSGQVSAEMLEDREN